ncbi:MAG: FecR domain-containing protein [Polyangiaceae bacterium]
MIADRDLAQLAAKALAAAPSLRDKPLASEEARAVKLVALTIRARHRRERRLRWAVGGIAAAATIATAIGIAKISTGAVTPKVIAQTPAPAERLGIDSMIATGVVREVTGDAYVLHAGLSRPVTGNSAIGAGEELVVERNARVSFGLPTGTLLTVQEGGDLTVVALGTTQLFRLSAGSVRADVHKLATGERFLVRTPDAEIEVRGTSFRVGTVPSDPSCGAGITTRLTVYEGVVVVRAGSTEIRVPAGHQWPSDCGLTANAPARTRPLTSSAGTSVAPGPVGSPRASRSELAGQNDLYASALAARQSGNTGAAVAAFEQLATKYPASPLAENAMAERMRLLAATHSPRAVDAARAYVTRYPEGFARTDAEAILTERLSPR